MGLLRLGFFTALTLATLALSARAESTRPDAAAGHAPGVLTGKERLGPKWTDEQRIDNCKVPPDRRGAKPRPSTCAGAPPS